MSKKPAAKKTIPKAPKVRTTPASKKKKAVTFGEEEDDALEDLSEAFSRHEIIDRGSNFSLNGGHDWKRCGYIRVSLENAVEVRNYEQRVDVFVGYPIREDDLDVTLSSCGNFVQVQTKIPSWFGSNKHYRAEYRAARPGEAFPISDSESTALLEVAQEIRKANPNMDDNEKLSHPLQTIPLSFQCKPPVLDLRVINVTCRAVTVRFNRQDENTFYFMVSFRLIGTAQIIDTRPQPAAARVTLDDWADLYD